MTLRSSSVGIGILVALLEVVGHCQMPVSASPCDLVKNPEQYSQKVVTVKANVSIGFENFTLHTLGCEENGRPIWLTYGGDEPTPTMSTVNDLSGPSGSVLKVNGQPVILRRDPALELFKRRLAAERLGGVTGQGCSGDCHLYNVTATLTGVFFAAPANQIGGYGHLGCCHLLAIEQVADVDARRTEVPAGGRFVCSTESREVGAAEAQALEEKRKQCHEFGNCRNIALVEVAEVAGFWGDSIDKVDQGNLELFGDLVWISPDLLKSYSLEVHFQDAVHNSGPMTGMTVSRMMCKAVSPPLPMTTQIGCRNLWSQFPTSKSEAKTIQNRVRLGDDPWRIGPLQDASRKALEDAAQRWGVSLVPGIQSTGCGKPTVFEDEEYSWCNWEDPEGMQSLSIQVTKLGSLRSGKSWESVPWVLTRGHGLVCAAEE